MRYHVHPRRRPLSRHLRTTQCGLQALALIAIEIERERNDDERVALLAALDSAPRAMQPSLEFSPARDAS